MGRLLCLDIGKSKTGVAVSDPTHLIAQGVCVIASHDIAAETIRIRELIEQYEVEKLIVGYPIETSGNEGAKSQEIKKIFDKISSQIDCPAELWDERFTTKIAINTMTDGGLSYKKQRSVVDMLAAQLILQSYLDAQNIKKEKKTKDSTKGVRNMEEDRITLKTDDGEELVYIVDYEFEFEGSDYVVLYEEGAEDEDEALLFRIEDSEDGASMLYDLEDDEFDRVNEYYISQFDEDEDDEEFGTYEDADKE